MVAKTIGFIGGGRIVRVFLNGWRKAGALPERFVISDANEQVLAGIKASFGQVQICPQGNALAAQQDVVFLALHPPVIGEALQAMVTGAVGTMRESGLNAAEVQDLIPVKPLADSTATILEAYRTRLPGLLAKIRPD